MTVDKQREALKSVYSGRRWVQKVDHMTNEQVTAIYLRLKMQNKL